METSEKIIKYIERREQATVAELSDHLGISRQAIHRHLNKLTKDGKLYKVGKSPKVFYLLAQSKRQPDTIHIEPLLKKLINDNFLIITPAGEKKEGLEGFIYWCGKQKLSVEKTSIKYEKTLKKYALYKKDGLINGMYKIRHTFPKVFLDKVFYLDFYSIERFGKTRLGQLLLYAKQSQNKTLIKELANRIRPQVMLLLKRFHINAVGYIPPTVRRETQLIKELERELNVALPVINLVKVKTPVSVPQKTLNKLEDRVENAQNTIVVNDTKQYKTVLLIDDALGSGATMNETAKKIKKQNLAKTVIGLAITGSFSGFEVISEV